MRETKIHNTKWVSLVNPTADDIKKLSEHFPDIHPLVLKDILSPTSRPSHVENFENHIYAVLHFPSFLERKDKTISFEIDFILFHETLITVHYEKVALLDELWDKFQSDQLLKERCGKTTAHLLSCILKQFFSFSLAELDQLQEKIDKLEKETFSGKEKEILGRISILKHNVLDFRRALKAQHITLVSLALEGTELFGEKTRSVLSNIVGEYMKVWNLLENHKETVDTIYDTNRQLLAAKTNEIMRVFTILAFITFIPTSIANIYGMNLAALPLAENPGAFWQVLGLMTLLTLAVYLVLRWRKLV